jgi:hypothetical protein
LHTGNPNSDCADEEHREKDQQRQGMKHVGSFLYGWSRRFNQIFGVIYLLVGLAGLVPAFYFSQRLLGLMHVNAADNVLHLEEGRMTDTGICG